MLLLGWCTAAIWSVALTIKDVRERRLPNSLTLPGAAVVVAVATLAGRGGPAIAGGLGLAAIYLIVHLLAPAGMGGGDVKLAVGLGALTGAFGTAVWTLAALGAPLLTAGLGVVAAGRLATLPHGPSMCAASLAATALAVY